MSISFRCSEDLVKKTALHAVHPMMMSVYVQAFISSMGIYFPLYGGHEFLTIRLERESERGGTVDVLFLFISSRYVTYMSCVRIVKNKLVISRVSTWYT